MSITESSEGTSANTIDPLLDELLDHRAKFLAFLVARVSDPATAEDILQAAYTRTLEKGGQIQKTESIVAWFYQILRNALTDHYRRDAARGRAHDGLSAETHDSYEMELQSNLCTCIQGVVQTLKPEYRLALEQIDLGGESIADFAKAEHTTPNNVSVRLHRARRAAAKRLIQVCGSCADHKCLDCSCKRPV
ncbi:MAG TPA: sigma-70 family RNA polymerase sigma factor [Acidobacteriaceae bacterium]